MPLINDLIPCGKGGIELDGFIREYQVQAGENIKAGDFIEISSNKVIPYSTIISGVANKSGSGGVTIEVWRPYYTYKKYTVSSKTTTTTGYVENKSSSTSSISLGNRWSTTYIAYANSIKVDFDTGTITLNNPSQVISNDLGNDATVLNNKYFMTSTSGYVTSGTQAYLGNNTNATTGWNNSKVAYTITTKQSTITTTTENKGDFIEEFKSEDRIYPDNGKHTDGYWYVLNGYDGSSSSSGGSGESAKTYTLTISGSDMMAGSACVAVNGTNYTSAKTLTLPEGTSITVYACASEGTGGYTPSRTITYNGTKVSSGSNDTASYTFNLSANTSVNIIREHSSNGQRWYYTATIKTT